MPECGVRVADAEQGVGCGPGCGRPHALTCEEGRNGQGAGQEQAAWSSKAHGAGRFSVGDGAISCAPPACPPPPAASRLRLRPALRSRRRPRTQPLRHLCSELGLSAPF